MRAEYEASSSICWRAVASSELLLTIIIRLLVVVDHDGFILDFNIWTTAADLGVLLLKQILLILLRWDLLINAEKTAVCFRAYPLAGTVPSIHTLKSGSLVILRGKNAILNIIWEDSDSDRSAAAAAPIGAASVTGSTYRHHFSSAAATIIVY